MQVCINLSIIRLKLNGKNFFICLLMSEDEDEDNCVGLRRRFSLMLDIPISTE